MGITATTFAEAVSLANTILSMGDCCPDGQADEVRELVSDYRSEYGRKTADWPVSAKESFIEEINHNVTWWI